MAKDASRRRPLSSLNANISPRKGGMKTPSKSAVKGSGDEFDDSTIDDNELMLDTARRGQRLDGMLEETEV